MGRNPDYKADALNFLVQVLPVFIFVAKDVCNPVLLWCESAPFRFTSPDQFFFQWPT